MNAFFVQVFLSFWLRSDFQVIAPLAARGEAQADGFFPADQVPPDA
jgi:hypothetical protein